VLPVDRSIHPQSHAWLGSARLGSARLSARRPPPHKALRACLAGGTGLLCRRMLFCSQRPSD
jgi:hypothetical protein